VVSGRGRRRIGGRLTALTAIAAIAWLAAGCSPTPPAQNLDPPPLPRFVGVHRIQPDLTPQIDAFFANDFADAFRNRRAVYVTVDGSPVAKRYNDSPPGAVYDVGAIRTAIAATLVGIALAEHRLRSVDQTVSQLLPSYRDVMSARMRDTTLGQLMSMTSGLASDDRVTQTGPDAEAVPSILAAGPEGRPGEFAYSSHSAVLVNAILAHAVGGSVSVYAGQHLFGPLGIRVSDTGNILRLGATDLARMGSLWLNRGAYGGRQIVPARWVAEMTRAQAVTHEEGTPAFGYGVWLTTADGHDAFAASGLGGQLVEVVRDLDLVVVVQSATDLDVLGASPAEVAGAGEYIGLVDGVIARAVS
jgi:CubicO group peptidase (beta-lactamase class C family)